MRRMLLLTALGVLGVAGGAAAQVPIPGPLDGPLPRYTGHAVDAQPLRGPWRPQNPALAPDGRSGTGLAAGNGAASPLAGPLGARTRSTSSLMLGTCAGIAFDARERVLATCNSPLGMPALRLIDPVSLATISTLALPPRSGADRTDVGGGTHFIVRADGSLLVPTAQSTLLQVAVDHAGLRQTGAIDLAAVLGSGEHPFAVAAGYDGRDWVAGGQGTVVAVARDGSPPRALKLGEPIAEDLATDPSGTFVVTRDALYRLVLGTGGTPRVVWREPILSGLPDSHAGRIHPGSGTAPVIVAGGYVAVTDGLDPARLMVMRIGGRERRRLACAVSVFAPRASSVEAPLVVAGRSVLVANAYGYDSLLTTEGGRSTTGGLARVIVGKRGCRTAWMSDAISPSAGGVVSRATGLLYTVVKPRSAPDAWNLEALDWRTGKVRFAALAGEGLGFNSDGAPVVLGPDGSAYAGSFGGITRFHDAG